jgi:hypothetical protein
VEALALDVPPGCLGVQAAEPAAVPNVRRTSVSSLSSDRSYTACVKFRHPRDQ